MADARDDGALDERKLQLLQADREDLRTVLLMRFGGVPADVEEKIMALQDIEQTNRLVLVAANAPDLQALRSEISSEIPAFRILSEAFEPKK
ncbi:MAG: hypothetical protein M0Z66_12620 [Thermaerobacter sp.]|nr:hypothetical protein [Thermaerobacter sp.]